MNDSGTVMSPHCSSLTPRSSIFVAGFGGLVGSAVVRCLRAKGYERLILKTHRELDLTDGRAVEAFFEKERPDCVIDAAARVGGIHANNAYPADFIRDNLLIQNNLIDHAWRFGVTKFVFLGSSCIYPRLAPQPMKEEYLLTGPLEPTNEWYAVAKIAGIKMCQAYRRQHGFDAISLMPTNLYGPGDNFNLENSHVLAALMRKFHEAKFVARDSVTIWGTGTPRREFLHVDDLAEAVIFLMENYSDERIINIGAGEDVSIRELAELVREVTGFQGEMVFDTDKPDGAPRKLLDVSRLSALGWKAKISLPGGIRSTYAWFLQHQDDLRR
jgi:GDP-L-fucose synthase